MAPADPFDTTPRWGEVGIHGVARPRDWDAVTTVEAPELAGDRVAFVALADGRLLPGDGLAEAPLAPLAAALDAVQERPYRAEAVRREGVLFAAGARAIDVVELPGPTPGQELELVVAEGRRTLSVDGEPAQERVPELERLAAARSDAYVARATRLAGRLWEVWVGPL